MASISPCPHCKHSAIVIEKGGKKGWQTIYVVACDYDDGGCGAQSGWYYSEAEAIDAWNQRALEEELHRLVLDLDACRREPKCCNCRHYRGEDADPWCGLRIEERVGELGALPD